MYDSEFFKNIDPESMTAEQKLIFSAMVFQSFFLEYIEEVDPELFKRAIDYAADSTKIPGVIINKTNDPPKESM
jgi:hypothetical protein